MLLADGLSRLLLIQEQRVILQHSLGCQHHKTHPQLLSFKLPATMITQHGTMLAQMETAGSYYECRAVTLVHDNDRYVRYKVYINTSDTAYTPVLSMMGSITFQVVLRQVQVVFPNLTPGNDYDLSVNMTGYQSYSENSLNNER